MGGLGCMRRQGMRMHMHACTCTHAHAHARAHARACTCMHSVCVEVRALTAADTQIASSLKHLPSDAAAAQSFVLKSYGSRPTAAAPRQVARAGLARRLMLSSY